MARELAPHGIRVNCVQPGHIATQSECEAMDQAARAEHGKRIPAGRMGSGEDIAAAVTFLCSSSATYITGSTLTVDGGYTVSLDLQSPGTSSFSDNR